MDAAARLMYERGPHSLRKSKELLTRSQTEGFTALLTKREKTGSAENPVTKLFPAAITEQRFIDLLDALTSARPGLTYADDRQTGHSLSDFTLCEGELRLPINIKNAGTPFRKAAELVGLDPTDCIPIPAYKAYAAIESSPNLLYAVSVDYELVGKLDKLLPSLFGTEEASAWDLLNRFAGARVQHAEDAFVEVMVRKHWEGLKKSIVENPFHVVSARKAIRLLQTRPKRTPGIGLKAWGTGAAAEVNVHLSIKEDTTPWEVVSGRVAASGILDVVRAVNRKRMEEVYDPEI